MQSALVPLAQLVTNDFVLRSSSNYGVLFSESRFSEFLPRVMEHEGHYDISGS